jgi:hypothetical protein
LEITIDEMLPSQEGNSFAVTNTPLTEKLWSTLVTLSKTTIIPSGDKATRWALSTPRRRKNLPLVIEWRSTPLVWEEVTTKSRSAFTQHETSSSACPLKTCKGPSKRRFLESALVFLSAARFDATPAADAAAATNAGSDIALDPAPELDVAELPWIRHSKAVASREPVTRVLPSGERAKHVTGAQWADALSTTQAVSVATNFTELSACPPAQEWSWQD